MQDQVIRFTPDEIKELVESGELATSDLQRMHEADRKIAMGLMGSTDRMVPFKDGMRPDTGTHLGENADAGLMGASMASMGPGALALGATALRHTPVIGRFALSQAPRIGRAIGGAVGAKGGHPWAGAGAGGAVGEMVRRALGGKRTTPKVPAGPHTPAEFTGTRTQGAMQGQTISPAPSGGSIPAPPPRPTSRPTTTGGGNGSRVLPGGSPTSVMSTGGTPQGFSLFAPSAPAQAAPSGPVGAYSSNVITESGMDELMELILGTAREGQTPMRWDSKDNRNAVDRLKRQVRRRSPR
jgi:hypothetical protein